MKARDYYFDNGKFLLIFLVAFGHLIRSYIESDQILLALYNTIYSFHMPAFILISGFFAKAYFKKGYIWNLTKKLLFPYLIFQLIYTLYYSFILDQKGFAVDPLDPEWSLWFLISLFCWHLMLPLYANMKPWAGITVAVAIGLLIGYVENIGNYLSLSRTFVFFPYFLLGYYLKKEHIQKLKVKSIMIPALLIFISAFGYFYLNDFNSEWLLGSKSYAQMEADLDIAAFQRLAVYAGSAILIFCFLIYVPNKSFTFTNIGKYTLYVYLLHGFIIKYFRESNLETWIGQHQQYWLLIPFAMLIVYVLSSNIIRTITEPLITIKVTKLRNLFTRAKKQNQTCYSKESGISSN